MNRLTVPPGVFRLLLAFAVLVSHLTNLDIGRLAVLLFFFLSGYWISDIWAKKFGPGAVGRFYLSRFLRIWPLFLIVTLAAAGVRGEPLQLPNFTLLGLGLLGKDDDPTRVSWSLDIELQFYLLAPFILAALFKAPRLTLSLSVAAVALGWWFDARFDAETLLKFSPAFLLGALTQRLQWNPGPRAANLSLAAFILATVATGFTTMLWKSHPDTIDHDVYGLIWMLPLLPYVAHSLTVKSGHFDRTLGNLSFPLYLLHPAVIFVFDGRSGDVTLKLAVTVVATFLSAGVYFLIDRPLDRWRVRLTERRAAEVLA